MEGNGRRRERMEGERLTKRADGRGTVDEESGWKGTVDEESGWKGNG